MPEATLVLDWFHIAMRFEHALQAARGLGAGTFSDYLQGHPIRELESAKWRLWHGRSSACLGRLARLMHWFDAAHVRDVKGAAAVQRHINDLIEYLYANELALVNYGRRRRDRLPISTAFVESAVNEILSKRMIKKQQMRWNRWTVQPFLDVRVAVLNKTLAGSFRRLYPDFQPDNENHPARLVSVTNPTTLHALSWDREKEDRSAGLRTFPLVAIASCGFIQAAEALLVSSLEGIARIVEGVITGIGFIGGGAILKTGASVHGTATAASLWATGAMGAAVADL